MKKFLFTVLKIAVSVIAISFLIRSGRLDVSQFVLTDSAVFLLGAASLVFILAMTLAFVRHAVLLKAAGVELPFFRVLGAGFISWFLNATLFGGFGFVSGDAVRVGYLLPLTSKKSAVFSATLVDRAMGLIGIILIAVTAFLTSAPNIASNSPIAIVASWVYGLATVGGLTLFFLIGSAVVRLRFLVAIALILGIAGYAVDVLIRDDSARYWVALLPPLAFGIALGILQLERSVHSLLQRDSISWFWERIANLGEALIYLRKQPSKLVCSILLAVTTHTLAVVTLFLVSRALAMVFPPRFADLFFAAPVASAIGMLPLPANGLGVGETAFDAALRLFHSDTGQVITGGAALFLAYRLLTVACGITGLPFFLSSKVRSK